MSRKLLAFALIQALLAAAAFADGKKFPGIEKLMSPEEFEAAGLDQLSDEQLQALDDWLLIYTAGESAVVRQQTDRKAIKEAEKEFAIESRIVGKFNGWSGKTVFRLENGQIWQQRLSDRYSYRGPPNPEVRITKNFMGFYKLTLVEDDRGVGVKLIK